MENKLFDAAVEELAWLKKTAEDDKDHGRVVGYEDCLIKWKAALTSPAPLKATGEEAERVAKALDGLIVSCYEMRQKLGHLHTDQLKQATETAREHYREVIAEALNQKNESHKGGNATLHEVDAYGNQTKTKGFATL